MIKGVSQWVLGIACFLCSAIQGDVAQSMLNQSFFSCCFKEKRFIQIQSVLKRVNAKKKNNPTHFHLKYFKEMVAY